jgi:lysozyme
MNTSKPYIVPSNTEKFERAAIKAKNLLKELEGLKLQAYECSAKRWTVGYGNTIINGEPVKEGLVITRDIAEELLGVEVNKIISQIKLDVSVICNHNQIAAIVSFIYNVGFGNWQKSTLRKEILKNPLNTLEINKEFNRWAMIKGSDGVHKRHNGLQNRRRKEIDLYFKPVN